jgi:hypothetical protein
MTIMYNRSRIWGSWPRNIEFRSVMATNQRFPVKLNSNTLDFSQKLKKKLKPIKTYIHDHYV